MTKSEIATVMAMIEPVPAAIIEAEPMPAPMARECGWKMSRPATTPARIEIQSAPKTVPQMYMPITPRPSGLSRPYFSPMMATLGSRSIE